MLRLKCKGCGRIYYEDIKYCPECSMPSSLNPPTNEEMPKRTDEKEPDGVDEHGTDG